MAQIKNSWLQAGLLGSALLLSSVGVWADNHGEHKGKHGDREGRYEQRMQERANALHDALKLQDSQKSAWDQFQAAMKPPARPEAKDREAHREAFKSMNTLQRLDWMKTMKAKREAQMSQRDEAIRSFYQQLQPAQQKTFDAQFWMRGGRDHGPEHDEGKGDHHKRGERANH